MPELPEVESIARQIQIKLPFRVKRLHLSKVASSILKKQQFMPEGMLVESVVRRAKMLDFKLNGGNHILSGLGMSGTWLLSHSRPRQAHCHIELEGHSESGLRWMSYCDPRRFGLCYFLQSTSYKTYLSNLGVDVSSDAFTLQHIMGSLKRYPQRQLKVLLLDQKYFGGVGNYLASEICARAGIRPTRRAGRVTVAEGEKLLTATAQVLKLAVEGNGVSFHGGYQDTAGNRGDGLKGLVVFYQKQCGLCSDSAVKKIILAQRGTYYCPKCQK